MSEAGAAPFPEPGRPASRAAALLGLDRRDLVFYLRTCGAVLAVLGALYGAAYLVVPPGYVFSGFLHDTHDAHAYRVWSNMFAHQGLLSDNPWSLTPRPPAHFNLIWWFCGRLMALGVPFMATYHLLRVVAGGLMLLMLLALMRELVRDRPTAWTAFLLASFGTGFSWIVALVSMDFFRTRLMPADIVHGDSFPANALWTFPHLALAYAFVAAIYLFMYRAAARDDRRWALAAAAVALPLGFEHPYHFLTVAPVLAAWHLALALKHGARFAARRWPDLAILAAGMLPGVAYYWHFFHSPSPNFAHWQSNNTLRTAGWLPVVAGFGFIMLLAFLGYRGLLPLKRRTDRYLLVAVWAPVNFAMHFSYPFLFFEFKLGAGLIIPLAVLASWAFFGSVLPALRRRAATVDPAADIEEGAAVPGGGAVAESSGWRGGVALLVLLCLPTTFLHIGNHLRELTAGRPWFSFTLNTKMKMRRGEVEAMRQLDRLVGGSAFPLVMVSYESGLVLPGFAFVRTFAGHVTMTADFEARMRLVRQFYGPSADGQRRGILRTHAVDYVWWGADEDGFGGTRPRGSPYLAPVFDNGTVTIYRVNREAL